MGDLLDIPISQPNSTAPASNPNPGPVDIGPAVVTPPAPEPSAIPDINEMQKTLEESGKLLNEVGINPETKVDTSPLAALQPENMLLTQDGPQPIRLPSEHQQPLQNIDLAGSGSDKRQLNWTSLDRLLIKWPLIAVYAALGAFSLLKAIKFYFLDFPQLEKSQALISATDNPTNLLLILHGVVLLASILLFFLVIQILRGKVLTLSFLGLSLVVAAACLFSNSQISIQAAKIQAGSNQLVNQTKSFTDSLLDMVPFLKRQEDGTVTPFWEKDITQP